MKVTSTIIMNEAMTTQSSKNLMALISQSFRDECLGHIRSPDLAVFVVERAEFGAEGVLLLIAEFVDFHAGVLQLRDELGFAVTVLLDLELIGLAGQAGHELLILVAQGVEEILVDAEDERVIGVVPQCEVGLNLLQVRGVDDVDRI